MKRKTICFLLLSLGMSFAAFAQGDNSDSLTITTYYPSPYGVYRNVRLYPSNEPTGAAKQPGVMYFDQGNSTMYYYNGSAWISIGNGGAGGLWAENETTHNIYNTNTGGRVGIGTDAPALALDISSSGLTGMIFHGVPNGGGELSNVVTLDSTTGQGWVFYTRGAALNRIAGFAFFDNSLGNDDYSDVANWGAHPIIMRPDGKVGINSTDPTVALDVNGEVEVNGVIRSGPPGQVRNGAGLSTSVTVSDLHDYHTSLPNPFPDPTLASVANLMCSIAACNRYCGYGCFATTNGCNGEQPGLGYHGGTAVEWNPISQTIMCKCF